MLREWYMHPNGQIPAYEWNFGDVNPPVHAWAALRVFQIERAKTGNGDLAFLERVFHKLLLNFDWWVNRKDALGNNIFQGGFLGLDNIGIFDRNTKLPGGLGPRPGRRHELDGDVLPQPPRHGARARRARTPSTRTSRASSGSTSSTSPTRSSARTSPDSGLWDEEDGFFYDDLLTRDGRQIPIRVRSLVGLIPLTAVVTGDDAAPRPLPDLQAPDGVVLRAPAGPDVGLRVDGPARGARAAPPVDRQARSS